GRRMVPDDHMPMRRLATHIRLTQEAVANTIVDPPRFHSQLAGQTADRPLLIPLVGAAMLMVRTDPVMAVANLHDGFGQDRLALRRAKSFMAQDVSNLKVRVALCPQLPGALDHRGVARDLTLAPDRREHDALREMATGPDDLDFDPRRSRPLDYPAGEGAARPRLAL